MRGDSYCRVCDTLVFAHRRHCPRCRMPVATHGIRVPDAVAGSRPCSCLPSPRGTTLLGLWPPTAALLTRRSSSSGRHTRTPPGTRRDFRRALSGRRSPARLKKCASASGRHTTPRSIPTKPSPCLSAATTRRNIVARALSAPRRGTPATGWLASGASTRRGHPASSSAPILARGGDGRANCSCRACRGPSSRRRRGGTARRLLRDLSFSPPAPTSFGRPLRAFVWGRWLYVVWALGALLAPVVRCSRSLSLGGERVVFRGACSGSAAAGAVPAPFLEPFLWDWLRLLLAAVFGEFARCTGLSAVGLARTALSPLRTPLASYVLRPS